MQTHELDKISKQELQTMRDVLIIQCCVRFHLIPQKIDDDKTSMENFVYKSLALSLLSPEKMEESHCYQLIALLSESQTCQTPQAQLSLYKKISELTNLPIELFDISDCTLASSAASDMLH